MPTLSEAIIASLKLENCKVEWSKAIKKIDSNKSDGYRFIGEFDELTRDVRVIAPGNHIAVVSCREKWRKLVWGKYPGSPRKGWQETEEFLPPNETPPTETGKEKWEPLGNKIAIAYHISKTTSAVIKILASVPWDGTNWGIELQEKAGIEVEK